jgi:hypothetical protein
MLSFLYTLTLVACTMDVWISGSVCVPVSVLSCSSCSVSSSSNGLCDSEPSECTTGGACVF